MKIPTYICNFALNSHSVTRKQSVWLDAKSTWNVQYIYHAFSD